MLPELTLVEDYERALALLEEAARLMDDAGDTLIAAHIATPIDALETKLAVLRRGSKPEASS